MMDDPRSIQSRSDSSYHDEKQRLWAVFAHLSALLMLLGLPLGNVLGPLVIWLIKRKKMPQVDEAGRQSLNFQISMSLYTLISFIVCYVFVGFLLILPILLFNIVMVLYATIKTSNQERFKYPLTIHFIR